jgi:pantoate--beta-alanine ligase
MKARVFESVASFRAACDEVRARGGKLALVPTMGALHAGHLALVLDAAQRADSVAVTIFVNPTQFGPNEDFERYPRALERDVAASSQVGASLVFAPSVGEMYPPGERTRVRVGGLTDALCGHTRPGHFEGVTTIVTKLFAIAGPCLAVFGRKDYQQLKTIQRMVRDLMLPVEIIGHPTVREPDGLALSSRNAYLPEAARERAVAIPRALSAAVQRFSNGERSVEKLRAGVLGRLTDAGLSPDYVTLADAESIEPLSDADQIPGRALLALAAFADGTRLIDNVVLGEDPAPIAGYPA